MDIVCTTFFIDAGERQAHIVDSNTVTSADAPTVTSADASATPTLRMTIGSDGLTEHTAPVDITYNTTPAGGDAGYTERCPPPCGCGASPAG